jgi:hypothetical protein
VGGWVGGWVGGCGQPALLHHMMKAEHGTCPARGGAQVPAPLREIASADEYMARLPEFDAEMSSRLSEAEAAGEVRGDAHGWVCERRRRLLPGEGQQGGVGCM